MLISSEGQQRQPNKLTAMGSSIGFSSPFFPLPDRNYDDTYSLGAVMDAHPACDGRSTLPLYRCGTSGSPPPLENLNAAEWLACCCLPLVAKPSWELRLGQD